MMGCASCLLSGLPQHVARLILEVDIGERLSVGVADTEALSVSSWRGGKWRFNLLDVYDWMRASTIRKR